MLEARAAREARRFLSARNTLLTDAASLACAATIADAGSSSAIALPVVVVVVDAPVAASMSRPANHCAHKYGYDETKLTRVIQQNLLLCLIAHTYPTDSVRFELWRQSHELMCRVWRANTMQNGFVNEATDNRNE